MTADGVRLVLGPLPYFWDADRIRDFYARIADEAPVDVVHVGEVVCGKRLPPREALWAEVADRLRRAGREVVLSTLALPAEAADLELLRRTVAAWEGPVEANDFAALRLLRGRPHHLGPWLNVYNEATLEALAARGAVRACPPPELGDAALRRLAAVAGVELEVQVFGRLPLALSARCHHARSRGRRRDTCRFACGEDPAGLAVDTLDGRPFLAINGIQLLSRAVLVRGRGLDTLRAAGIRHLRLVPEAVDMVRVIRLFRDLVDGRCGEEELRAALAELLAGEPTTEGFRLPATAGAAGSRMEGGLPSARTPHAG